MQTYLEDLEYMYEALKKHPSFLFGKKSEQFENLYKKVALGISDYSSLLHAMEKLTMFFEDGHTNIEIPYTPQEVCVRILCQWINGKLFLTEDYEDIKAGAEIIAVENLKIDELVKCATQYIPHENIYLVKSRMTEYPYMNYQIFSKMNLVRMFSEKEFYEVIFKIKYLKKVTRCVLKKYDGFLDF